MPLSAEQRLASQVLGADWSVDGVRVWPLEAFQSVQWAVVASLAWQYKIRPMTTAALREAGWPGVPGAVRSALEQAERDCVTKSMQQVALLREIAATAEGRGLRVIVMKGVALSAHLYGDVFIREAFDLDLLVHPEETERLDDVLATLGFQPASQPTPLSARQEALLERFHHDRKFVHPASGVIAERHRALSGNAHLIATDFDRLWDRRGQARIADYSVAILGDADLARYLAVHAARHGWERWKWIADLAVLYYRAGETGLARLRDDARTEGLLAIFNCAVLLVAATTGTSLPSAAVSGALGDRRARRLAIQALRMVSVVHTPDTIGAHRARLRGAAYRLLLKPTPGYLAFELAAFVHHDEDWRALRLPDGLIPLYYLAWPFFYLGRRLRALARSRGPRPEGQAATVTAAHVR